MVYYYNLLYTSDVISLIILGGCKNTEIGKRKSSQISERNLLYFKIRKDYLKFLGLLYQKMVIPLLLLTFQNANGIMLSSPPSKDKCAYTQQWAD